MTLLRSVAGGFFFFLKTFFLPLILQYIFFFSLCGRVGKNFCSGCEANIPPGVPLPLRLRKIFSSACLLRYPFNLSFTNRKEGHEKVSTYFCVALAFDVGRRVIHDGARRRASVMVVQGRGLVGAIVEAVFVALAVRARNGVHSPNFGLFPTFNDALNERLHPHVQLAGVVKFANFRPHQVDSRLVKGQVTAAKGEVAIAGR